MVRRDFVAQLVDFTYLLGDVCEKLEKGIKVKPGPIRAAYGELLDAAFEAGLRKEAK